MKIISGNSNELLSKQISEKSGIPLTAQELFFFNSGEPHCKIKENIRGEDVFIIQSLVSDGKRSNNDYLNQLTVMIDAAKRSSAQRITAVLPYFPCRQDRKTDPRTPITSKLWADTIVNSGADRILTMHLHNLAVEGFFNCIVDHLPSTKLFTNYILSNFPNEDYIVVSPDIGALKNSRTASNQLNCELAISIKERLCPQKVQSYQFIGDVTGKTVIIFDDLTETFGTIKLAAKLSKENGAKKVITCVTHLLNSEILNNKENFEHIDLALFSDTCRYFRQRDKIKQISVSDLFSQAIRNIHLNKSISQLINKKI